jgi:hypothetical protein
LPGWASTCTVPPLMVALPLTVILSLWPALLAST